MAIRDPFSLRTRVAPETRTTSGSVRLERAATLPKYDIVIKLQHPRGR
jgi:hypothetical protein